MPTPETQTLSERVTVLETLADTGTPALQRVREEVQDLRDEIRNHNEVLNRQEERQTEILQKFSEIASEHNKLFNVMRSTRTVILTLGVVFLAFGDNVAGLVEKLIKHMPTIL